MSTRRLRHLAIALVGYALASPAVDAQERGADPTDRVRERWALVGIWTPGLHRVGLLIPLTDRLLLRPDLQAYAWRSEGDSEGSFLNPGISVVVRTRPREGSWAYASVRAAFAVDVDGGWEDWSDAYTLTVGAHARLSRILGVFGEAGVSYIYDEDSPDAYIYRTYEFVSRFGFALSRPPRR